MATYKSPGTGAEVGMETNASRRPEHCSTVAKRCSVRGVCHFGMQQSRTSTNKSRGCRVRCARGLLIGDALPMRRAGPYLRY